MPSDLGFAPRSPIYGPFLVLGQFEKYHAQSGPFLVIFGPFLRHIVELEGNKGLFVTRKSRRTRSVGTVSLRLAVLNGFQGRFGQKKAVFGQKMRNFGRAPADLAPQPRGTTGEFLAQNLFSAQNLDLARPPPMVCNG